jgi:peptidoglycan/xylan/chitin deacetylase (PgdA/CDA1 family)
MSEEVDLSLREWQPAVGVGAFTLSLDFELIWGTLDLFGPDRFRRACEIEREVIIDRLLALFVEFDIPATWCVLGHLFLGRCESQDGCLHPEIVRPNHAWSRGDWFAHDPGGDEEQAPIFLGRSLVKKIKACPVQQEIGCHSFSHVIFGDTGCSRETAVSELAASTRLAREIGIEMKSFAFPRNEVGHLDVLKEYGFTSYRGPEPTWYDSEQIGGVSRRLAHLWDVVTIAEPPVVLPEFDKSGLWNVPGSMIYFPAHGLRRYLPIWFRVKRAIKGLNAAASRGRIFHLWFHPTNLAEQTDRMFVGLRRILRHAAILRESGRLETLPMRKLIPGDTHSIENPERPGIRGSNGM